MALPQNIREAAEAAKSGQASLGQLATLKNFLGNLDVNDVFLADGVKRAICACERYSKRDVGWMGKWLDGIMQRASI